MDMTEGIVARFRTMAISRDVSTDGHVVGAVVQTMLAMLLVLVVAVLVGFRPTRARSSGSPPPACCADRGRGHLAVLALGLSTRSVETASNLPMLLMLLLFLGSGFVPTATMPARSLVRGAPAVHADHRDAARAPARHADRRPGVVAVGWCVAMSVLGFLAAQRLYERDTTRA